MISKKQYEDAKLTIRDYNDQMDRTIALVVTDDKPLKDLLSPRAYNVLKSSSEFNDLQLLSDLIVRYIEVGDENIFLKLRASGKHTSKELIDIINSHLK